MYSIPSFIKKFILILFTLLFLMTGTFYFGLNLKFDTEVKQLIYQSQREIELIRDSVIKDFLMISNDSEIYSDIVAHHINNGENDLEEIARVFINNIQLRKGYYEMKLISVDGNELVKVKRKNDIPIKLTNEELKNISSDSDWYDIKNLSSDDIYFSDIYLLKLNGEVQIPFLPILKCARRINFDNEVVGYFTFEFDVSSLIDKIQKQNNSIYKTKIVVNDEGNFIFSDDPKDNWAYVFSENAIGMSEKFPDMWSRIKGKSRGYFESDNWIMIYEKLDLENILIDNRLELSPNSVMKELFVIDYISKENMNLLWVNTVNKSKKYFAIVSFLCIILALFIGNIINRLSYYKEIIVKGKSFDHLTGVYNRDMGIRILKESILNTQMRRNRIGIGIIKIKNIREINRKYGYSFGDEVIRELSQNITSTLGDDGNAIRLNGNTFIIFMEDTDYVKIRVNIELICEKRGLKEVGESDYVELEYAMKIIECDSNERIEEIIGRIEEELMVSTTL